MQKNPSSPLPDSSFPKLWPFEEARKIAKRVANADPSKPVLLETGYGPSGLPHIGTFGEVARTTWVRQAFEAMTGRSTRLLAFSDDMDALRKVPGNVPQQEMLEKHLGLPLSRIPDPFGTHESFAAHNNARLRQFLDSFGFEYEFASATDYYTNGTFDAALKRVLEEHDKIIAVIAPTLGKERRATYSPVLPIHPKTGQVMQVPILAVNPESGTVRWEDEAGEMFETSVYGGQAKMQWKADWAMRWYALGVDYEMSGKDLIDSVKLSSKICRILGKEPPVGLTYELFLDSEGQKISKSKGNGLSVEEWLRYGPAESLGQYMFQQPTRAKRLYTDMIPRAADDYLTHVQKAKTQDEETFLANPVWFLHNGTLRPQDTSPVSFTALLNLASVANAKEAETLWKFLQRYDSSLSPETHPYVARLVEHALAYFNERVRPRKVYRAPNERERKGLEDLAAALKELPADTSPDDVQNVVFEVGKRYFEKSELRSWFGCLYEVLLGQSEGPRFGIFAALFGLNETVALIEEGLARPAVAEPLSEEVTEK
ncbi:MULTISPECIES: lysine--tRNA ligase [unclassified Saccharibacter]|uniref:lysine--tRNA ligase n=1 Tax=unclassified Saccharibacter TaxID=2648722 RepID=UPI001323983C|nr:MULTISPECIES: lysine--tRNA ligase [unclassified Saccharibacter]MXV36218.1 lysine--tRNA ligase [Saccharibacter sp. EH611]MXV57078.1 lysine--tRNA ligase [Saccharibacter sp. EH70]MXV66562.1 lysine--tRNA ligase [Saccharibacter sp. EH60]